MVSGMSVRFDPEMEACVLIFLNLLMSVWSTTTYLNAAIVGYKGKTNFENYKAVADKLNADNPLASCKLNFTEVAYDKADGLRVYQSLTSARSLFENDKMAIAIGPYIDVFTSKQYVIQKQAHIVTSSIEKSEPSPITYPILPDHTSMSKAIAKIVKSLRWKKVAFLSQDDFAPVLSLSQEDIFVLPIQLPPSIKGEKNDSELRQTLTTLRKAHMEQFVLHSMDRDVVKSVIDAATDLHMLHHSRKWFVTYLDFEDVFDKTENSATLFGLQLLDKTKLITGLHGTFFETKSRFEVSVLVDTVNMLRHYLSVSADCSAEPESDRFITAKDLIRKTTDNPFTGILGVYKWFTSSETNGSVKTDFSLNITRLNGHSEAVGNVTFHETGLKLINTTELTKEVEHRLEDVLSNKFFSVITRLEPPFVQRGQYGDFDGFCVDILKELSHMMNFKYNISLPANSATDWDIIIQQIVEGNGDMIIGSLDVRSAREEKISFSTTIFDSSVSLLLQKPPATPTFFQFLWPFTTGLWMMILLVFFVVGGALFLMGRYDSTQRGAEQQFDIKESLWYSLNVLLQGGTDYSPQTTSMRTIVAIYWFCTLIITTAYTANLAAFLTLKNIDNRVKRVEDLVSQTRISYGVLKDSDLAKFLVESDVDLYKRMLTYMKLNEDQVILPTREKAREKVLEKDSTFVFLDDKVMNEHFAMENCKTVESIDQGFGSKQYSFGFPRGAPYRDDINRALLMLKENGRLDKIKDKWWVSNCTEAEEQETAIKSSSELGIENMLGVFMVLGGSVVLAVIVEVAKRSRLKLEKYYKQNICNEST